MALPLIKTTYTMDAETKRVLDQLARQWAVSRSEALRRAIRQAAGAAAATDRLAALEVLQRGAGLGPGDARDWEKRVLDERVAGSGRHRNK